MTQPGWYPDQNGGPGRKYWDGKAWHDSVPGIPPALPPMPPPAARPPAALPPAGNGRISRRNSILSGVVGFVVTIGGFLLIANWLSSSGGGTAPATPNIAVPSVSLPGVQMPTEAPARSQDAPLGTALVMELQQFQMDGSITKATAAVNVGNLKPMSDGVIAPAGTYYAAGVAVSAVRGSVSVNPFSFSARTGDGTNLMPNPIPVDNMLPATELPEGQKVAGFLGFDVPNGQRIKEIIYQEVGGPQLGRWLVQ